MKIRLLYINTHAGQALREGGVVWAVTEHDPDVVALVEVGRRPAQDRVVGLFPDTEWSITGLKPRRRMVVESGTLIMAKRAVLTRKSRSNLFLTDQRWIGGQRDEMHPIRRRTRAFYVFTEEPDVRLHVGVNHAWTHFRYRLLGDHEIPTEYRKQIRAFAEDAADSVGRGATTVHVGDMNALPADGDFVQKAFEASGMKLLTRQRLDFLLGSANVELIRHKWIPKTKVHTDHPALVADLELQ